MRGWVVGLVALGFSAPGSARIATLCWASFEGERGAWSQPKRVDIDFLSARELYPDTDAYPVYARIWYSRSTPSLTILSGRESPLRLLSPAYMNRLFPDDQWVFAVDDPQRWRIRCREGREWVDPRLADLIDPPPPVPEYRRMR